MRTNAAGFRSDAEFEKKRGARPRILVFGDSFTAGEGCNNQERYAELLGEELDAEVYNYGLSGSAPDQHILIYEEFCQGMEADLVVWGISIHNIDRIQLTHRPSVDRVSHQPILIPKPYFSLEDGKLQLHHVPVPQARPQTDDQSLVQYEEGHMEPPGLEQFYQMAWLRPVRRLLRSSLSDLKHHVRALVYRWTDVQMYEDYQDEDSSGWRLMAAIIKRFHAGVAKIPLLIVPLPTYHYYVDKLTPIYEPLFASLADVHGGLFVHDLTSDLVRLPLKQRTQLCFEQDSHYSPFGHQEIARHIAEEIRARKLLPAHGAESKVAQKRGSSGSMQSRYILGFSAFCPKAAAALVQDGQIIAAVEEECLTRVKGDYRFPHQAINYCLEEGKISQHELAAVVYDKVPSLVLEHIVHSVLVAASEELWLERIRDWVNFELNISQLIRQNMRYDGLLLQVDHAHSMLAGKWIQPSAGDVCSALGAALHADVTYFGGPHRIAEGGGGQGRRGWGPAFSNDEVRAFLDTHGYHYHMLDERERAERVADMLSKGRIVGHVCGRMEFGTHGLGARSILGDPGNPDVCAKLKGDEVSVRTVNRRDHPEFYDILIQLEKRTGNGVVLNAPFNLHGGPTVCTPDDAYHCFMVTDIDVLVIENFLLLKSEQPDWPESDLTGTVGQEPHADIHSQDPFVEALRTLYAKKVEPLARKLKETPQVLEAKPLRTTSPQGQDRVFGASANTVYTIPLQLDQPEARAKDVTEAIVCCWQDGPVVEGFRPILTELIRLKARFGRE